MHCQAGDHVVPGLCVGGSEVVDDLGYVTLH